MALDLMSALSGIDRPDLVPLQARRLSGSVPGVETWLRPGLSHAAPSASGAELHLPDLGQGGTWPYRIFRPALGRDSAATEHRPPR